MADYPDSFELMLLLAVLRLDEREAYGVPISAEIEHATGRRVALASVYAALDASKIGLVGVARWRSDCRTGRSGETVLPCDRQGTAERPARKARPRQDVARHS